MPVLFFTPQPAQPARGCTETSKRTRAATLQRIASAARTIQAILCNQSRPECSRLPDRMEPRRGSGGNRRSCDSPRRLCAAFDARKRPPARCILQQQRNSAPRAADCRPYICVGSPPPPRNNLSAAPILDTHRSQCYDIIQLKRAFYIPRAHRKGVYPPWPRSTSSSVTRRRRSPG